MKKIVAAAGIAAAALVGSVAAAAPRPPRPRTRAPPRPGRLGACELGLLQAAARQQIDYSTLADQAAGPIYADLPAGSYLSSAPW